MSGNVIPLWSCKGRDPMCWLETVISCRFILVMVVSPAKSVSWCPFMVSLKQNVNGTLMQCGGTILTSTLTLTAAHCLIFGLRGLMLKFGSVHLFKGGVQHLPTRILFHKEFEQQSLLNDIAMLSIFPAQLTYSFTIQPVKLPDVSVKMLKDSLVSVFGWGATSKNKTFSMKLRGATLPMVTREICQPLLKGWVPNNTFCLGYPDGREDSCLGDSGGPAIFLNVQVGITSFGEGCAKPLKPGVYTDVTKYIDWINNGLRTEL